LPLPQPLHPPHRCPGKIELLSQPVLQKPLKREVQLLLLVGKEQERRRRCLRLCHIVNSNRSRLRQRPALQIDGLQPTIQLRRRDLSLPRFGHAINQREQLVGTLARLRRQKNHRGVTYEFQLFPDQFFVIQQQLALVRSISSRAPSPALTTKIASSPCFPLGR